MKISTNMIKQINIPLSLLFVFVLGSCSSSYQYSGYEADGIYGEARPGLFEEQPPATTQVKPNNGNSYYKNLFAQQGNMYGEILESDVFTDVDSYSSSTGYDEYYDVGGDVAYVGGQAPWGESPDSYSVNIYNNFNGIYNPWRWGYAGRWGWNAGWGYPYGGWGWNDPFFNPYWGSGFGMAWNGWGWNAGWGSPYGAWGYPFYGGGFGYAFNSYWGYPGRYGYGYNAVAYNNSRRDSRDYSYNGRTNDRNVNYSSRSQRVSDARNMNTRRTEYSRRISEIRNSRTSDNSQSSYSRTRSSVNSDNQMYSRSSRRTESSPVYRSGTSKSPVYRNSSSSNNNRTYRSSTPTRSSAPTTRSSSSSSRSSGSSTTRSSGGSSSRGSGRGGRG